MLARSYMLWQVCPFLKWLFIYLYQHSILFVGGINLFVNSANELYGPITTIQCDSHAQEHISWSVFSLRPSNWEHIQDMHDAGGNLHELCWVMISHANQSSQDANNIQQLSPINALQHPGKPFLRLKSFRWHGWGKSRDMGNPWGSGYRNWTGTGLGLWISCQYPCLN